MATTFSGSTLCDHVKIRFKSDKRSHPLKPVEQPWKDFKKQWAVLTISLSPFDCYINYCSKEEDWLKNNQSVSKLQLKKFLLINSTNIGTQIAAGSKTKENHIIEIQFDSNYSIILQFESMTKKQQWFNEIEKIRCRTFAELIRSPQHPEREGEYVLEICKDRIKLWDQRKQKISFEWKLQAVRRAQYYNKVGKVEIEVGRATETGEGNYYFIGLEIKQFFYTLKENIFQLGKTSPLTQSTNSNKVPLLDTDTCSSTTTDTSTDDDYTGMFIKPPNTDQVMSPSPVLPLPVLPPLPASLSSMDTKIPQQVENELKNSETTISSDKEDITGSQADYQTLIDLTRNSNTLYDTIKPLYT